MLRAFQRTAMGLNVRYMMMGTKTSGATPTLAPVKPSRATPITWNRAPFRSTSRPTTPLSSPKARCQNAWLRTA